MDRGLEHGKLIDTHCRDLDRKQLIKEVDVENVISEILNVTNTWQTFGTLAGVVVLLQVLMKMLKMKPVNEFFTKYKIKWIKPYIAITLGAVSGGIGAYTLETEIVNGIIAGIGFGLSSIGWNETINKLKSSNRRK